MNRNVPHEPYFTFEGKVNIPVHFTAVYFSVSDHEREKCHILTYIALQHIDCSSHRKKILYSGRNLYNLIYAHNKYH